MIKQNPKKPEQKKSNDSKPTSLSDQFLGKDRPLVQSMLKNKEVMSIHFSKNSHRSSLENALDNQLTKNEELEAKLDQLRIFKKEQTQIIQKKDLSKTFSLPEIFSELTLLAEVILDRALKLAEEEVRKTYGVPSLIDNDGNRSHSELAVIGMGKFGGSEIHYGSDLDLIFLYSRNGNTEGRKKISNQEFYAKLIQKLISYLSVYTSQGIAYKIDTQLRPSGNQGTLIASLDSFAQYQRDMAQSWEKQALLKARVVTGHPHFKKNLEKLIVQFIFSNPFPNDLNQQMHKLRMRMEKEIAKENSRRLHYKLGLGGLADIEFAVQYIQLKMGKIFQNLLTPNTLQALEKMGEREILKKEDYETLKSNYLFYRRLEMRMETSFDLRSGYLDPQSPLLENLSEVMEETSEQDLIEKFQEVRKKTREVYLKALKIENL